MSTALAVYGAFGDDAHRAMVDGEFVRARAERLTRTLWDDHRTGALTSEELCRAAAVTWFKAVRPLAVMPPSRWRAIFAAAGYGIDGRPADRPAGPIRLYRAAVVGKHAGRHARAMSCGQIMRPQLGWSWTASRREADQFARERGRQFRQRHLVFAVDAPPDALLAQITINDEFVIDTRCLAEAPKAVDG